MQTRTTLTSITAGIMTLTAVIIGVLTAFPERLNAQITGSTRLMAESAILTGLPAGGLFPFLDSTPNNIVSAHVVLTDTTTQCAAGAAPPSNLEVLIGEAGVALTPVMTAATNTGIGTPNQCVFHFTGIHGRNGLPRRITDIVVVNRGVAPLTAVQTVSASAEVDSNNHGRRVFESEQD